MCRVGLPDLTSCSSCKMNPMPARAELTGMPAGLAELPDWLEAAEGFPAVVEGLLRAQAATIDGAWNSSASLVAATLGRQAPATLLVVLAHPRSLDDWATAILSFAGIHVGVFPAWDSLPTADTVIDEIGGQRLRVLRQLEGDTPPRILLTTMQALLQPVPDREQLGKQRKRLRVGQDAPMEEIVTWLVGQGLQRMEAVEIPGEFSSRGGILDVFSPDAEAPYRIEFVGDEIESIRQFSPESQRSLGDRAASEIPAPSRPREGEKVTLRGNLCDFLPARSWTMLVELEELDEQGKAYLERAPETTGLFAVSGVLKLLVQLPSIRVAALPIPSVENTCHLRVESVERFSGDVSKVRDALDAAATS